MTCKFTSDDAELVMEAITLDGFRGGGSGGSDFSAFIRQVEFHNANFFTSIAVNLTKFFFIPYELND
jgi:hypothetical protein